MINIARETKIQKAAEETGDLIGNKIANTNVSKFSKEIEKFQKIHSKII